MAKKKKAAASKGKKQSTEPFTSGSRRDSAAADDPERTRPGDKLPFPHGASLKETGPSRGSGNDGQGQTNRKTEAAGQKQASQGGASPEPDYYKLKFQAVEDLVTASPENSPPVSRQELRKYHAGPKVHLADWVKAILLKVWFAGVICYFFVWGLSTYSFHQWDLLLILGIALGGVTNLLTNNIYRFIAKKEGAYDRWMMFPGKSLAFLPLDILYAMVLILCTFLTYNGINGLFSPDAETTFLGVEPILFGIFVTLWDLAFLGIKQLFKRILFDAKQKVLSESR